MAELNRLIVVCARPGARIAGVVHPHLADYDIGTFSRAQLREMLAAEPLRLFLGRVATAADFGLDAPADLNPARQRAGKRGH